MSRTKQPQTAQEVYEAHVVGMTFDDRVDLHKLLTVNIKKEAEEKKADGERAAAVLKNIENNLK